MAQYKLLRGKHSYVDAEGNRVTVNAGEVVELSPDQAEAFKDKFKHVVIVAAEDRAAAEIAEVEANLKKPKKPKEENKTPTPTPSPDPAPAPAPAPVGDKTPAPQGNRK